MSEKLTAFIIYPDKRVYIVLYIFSLPIFLLAFLDFLNHGSCESLVMSVAVIFVVLISAIFIKRSKITVDSISLEIYGSKIFFSEIESIRYDRSFSYKLKGLFKLLICEKTGRVISINLNFYDLKNICLLMTLFKERGLILDKHAKYYDGNISQ